MSYTPNGNASLRLSYSMGKQVPDIKALNPYIYTNVPGQVSYGNPNLKPQSNQALSLSFNVRMGKVNLFASSNHSFAKDIILQHSFLEGDIRHIAMNNIGRRYENTSKVLASSKVTPTTWMQLEASLYYTDYAATSYYSRNHGFTFSTSTYMEQELPHDIDISLGAGYNSPFIYMFGRGEENYYYNLRVDKSFQRPHITLSAEAKSFLPLYYSKTHINDFAGYYSVTRNRSLHASFLLTFRYRFGRLKADERRQNEPFDIEYIKREYDE